MVKNPPANTGDVGSIPGSGRSPGEGGNLLQYSCLENPTDRGAWKATVMESQRVRRDLGTKTQKKKENLEKKNIYIYICIIESLYYTSATTTAL